MSHIRIGVLRSGSSHEVEKSFKIGGSVLRNMPEGYKGYDIFVDKKGQWHFRGIPVEYRYVSDSVDIIFNASQSVCDKNSVLHQELGFLSIPYTGSELFPSIMALDKVRAKKVLADIGVKTPLYRIIKTDDDIKMSVEEIFRNIPLPLIIKPVSSGSSLGVSVVKNYIDIASAVKEAFSFSNSVIVEEYIKGKEAVCSVLEDFRGDAHYTFPSIEISTKDYGIFDNESKSINTGDHVCPGCFTKKEKSVIARAAQEAHKALGLRHYSTSDFIISPRGVYFLEINTLPDLYEGAPFVAALKSVGSSISEFVQHVIRLAVRGK